MRSLQGNRFVAAPAALGLAIALAAAALTPACTIARDLPNGAGEHPEGWADKKSDNFHQHWLRKHGDEFYKCAKCHGEDYGGGGTGVACTKSGCHTKPTGPEYCGTCHGSKEGNFPPTGEKGYEEAGRPSTGAHARHSKFCNECHDVPTGFSQPDHINGKVKLSFKGMAITGGAVAEWDPDKKLCTNYCHTREPGRTSPPWEKPTDEKTACTACHVAAPGSPDSPMPASHGQWAHLAKTPADCSKCHGGAVRGPDHLNGVFELDQNLACNTCHGHGPDGAPAPGVDGKTAPTERSVGAHQRHLDPDLPGRIGHVARCDQCHQVPDSVLAKGHLDTSAPANVVLTQGGIYDPDKQSCDVVCHWNRPVASVDAGTPVFWTNTSGDARKCDACHAFPPVLKRDGTPHTAAPPELSACLKCHPFSPTTHVDGQVELVP